MVSQLQCVNIRIRNCHRQILYPDDSTLVDDIGFIVPVARKRDNYVIGIGTRICEITWVPPSPTFKIIQTLTDVGNTEINRINDGKADVKGRLFFGMMNRVFAGRTGSFYRLSKSHGSYELVELFDQVEVSNGLAWSGDLRMLYYIDSTNQTVTGYDYNRGTGNISKGEKDELEACHILIDPYFV